MPRSPEMMRHSPGIAFASLSCRFAAGAVLGEKLLALVAQWLVDDGGVLCRIRLALMGDLAPVSAVLQHQIECATGYRLAPIRGAVGPNPSFAPDPGTCKFVVQIAD